MCNPQEVQAIKNALARNANNIGIGIIHEPTGQIHLAPFDDVPGGHAQLASDRGLALHEVKGFLIGVSGSGYQIVNLSHLNNQAQGAIGSMAMPQPLFDEICRQLSQVGLQFP